MTSEIVGNILLGRYRIEELIGRGGMAEVYKAWDMHRMYYVAIKVMREDIAEDLEFLRRFQGEAKILAGLAHANIVRFYGFERDRHLAFIVMDYVEGITMRRRILEAEGKPLPLEEVLSITQQVCAALHYAHSEGMIHRDVKPGNIMLRPNGQVLLSDFGIAKAIDSATVTTVMPGTPAYMSPEQCLSQPLDHRTDIYALGIVIYEMLAGRRPFIGDQANITGTNNEKVRWEHLKISPPSLRQFNPAIPPALEKVVVKCLEKQPQNRYANVIEFLEAFQQSVSGAIPVAVNILVVHPQASRAAAIAENEVVTPLLQPREVVKSPKPISRNKIWAYVIAGGLALSIAVILLISPRLYPVLQPQNLILQPTSTSFIPIISGGTENALLIQGTMQKETITPLPTLTSTPTITPTPLPTSFAGYLDLKIIVQKEDNGDYFLFDENGTELANLSEGVEGKKTYSSLSPDARRLLFVVSPPKPAPQQFWIVEIGGGTAQKIFEMAGQYPWVGWSPDAQRFLVCIYPENTTNEINYFLKDLNSSEPIFIHKVYYERYDFEWSPDGKHLALICDSSEVCLVDPSTGGLTSTGFKAGGDLSFSPDTQWLMWDSFQYWYYLNVINDMKIFVWRIGEAEFKELTTAKWLDAPTYPIWSRDSQSIYYTNYQGGKPQLMQSRLDDNEPTIIQTYDQRIRLLSLSPDGRWISIRNIIRVTEGGSLYLRSNQVGVVRVEDGSLFWTKVDIGETPLSFWSPDGKSYIIYDVDHFIILDLESGQFTSSDWLGWVKDYHDWVIVQPSYNYLNYIAKY